MKGHIRERSRGRWAIVLDTRDSTGKRKRRWHSFVGTKREAQIECARLIAEAQGGTAVDPTRITVAQYLERFLRDWVAVHTTARTTPPTPRRTTAPRAPPGRACRPLCEPGSLRVGRSNCAPRPRRHPSRARPG
jgi:Arm DNA-binding domain